jgi:hypothetical protein
MIKSKIQVNIKTTHDYILIRLKEDKSTVTLTWKRSGDKCTATVDIPPAAVNKIFKKFVSLRSSTKKSLGEAALEFKELAESFETLEQFSNG